MSSLFASRSLLEHGLRGLVGIGGITAAVALGGQPGPLAAVASLALGVLALLAFRGCPICWTIGLVETVRTLYGRGRPHSS